MSSPLQLGSHQPKGSSTTLSEEVVHDKDFYFTDGNIDLLVGLKCDNKSSTFNGIQGEQNTPISCPQIQT
jgi:hypothetical protein